MNPHLRLLVQSLLLCPAARPRKHRPLLAIRYFLCTTGSFRNSGQGVSLHSGTIHFLTLPLVINPRNRRLLHPSAFRRLSNSSVHMICTLLSTHLTKFSKSSLFRCSGSQYLYSQTYSSGSFSFAVRPRCCFIISPSRSSSYTAARIRSRMAKNLSKSSRL